MADIGTQAFEAVYAGMTEARTPLRFGRATVSRALCAGVGSTRNPTEIGGGTEYDVSARYLQSDDPARGSAIGDICEMMPYGETVYSKYRIMGRTVTGGIVRLQLEFVHGQ